MIKATFEKIGPIKNAELELGDLTIIAGQNNTGKTYLVYVLYGFLNMREEQVSHVFRTGKEKSFKEIENITKQLKHTGRATLDHEEYKRLKNLMIRQISSYFSARLLSGVFSSPDGEFESAVFQIETEIKNGAMEDKIRSRWGEGIISMKCFPENGNLIFELNIPENGEILSMGMINGGVRVLLHKIIRKHFPEPFILSAERFGISLFYKELDFTKNRLVEELQKLSDEKRFDPFRFLERESARYAKPIKDNIDFTRDLSRIQRETSGLQTDRVRSVNGMMDGYYKTKSDEIRFVSKRRGNNRFDIPLHLASSSTRGVSDLYFYLKHIAQPGQILIIDEPESHLSPTNQVLMARLLVFCVNSGLKVLITTHSDYLIKEINNLIMLNGDFEGKSAFLKKNKKDYTENDYLKPESVKAYICEDGTLSPCSVDERGIDMPVFDNAIDKINRISMELTLLKTPDDLQ